MLIIASLNSRSRAIRLVCQCSALSRMCIRVKLRALDMLPHVSTQPPSLFSQTLR